MTELARPRPLDASAFREPNRDFGILPFWFLNGELDPDEMRFQLRELRDKGMHGVVFHGRYGLELPYLSASASGWRRRTGWAWPPGSTTR